MRYVVPPSCRLFPPKWAPRKQLTRPSAFSSQMTLSHGGKRPEWQIVGEASDGLEAVQMAVRLSPDVVILDISMPALNGLEAAKAIRNFSSKSRIIFFSEHAYTEIRDAALLAGGDAYVIKSNAASELVSSIVSALARVY